MTKSLMARGLKLAILAAIGFYIYWQLRHEEDLTGKFWTHIYNVWESNSLFFLVVPLLLMPVNWAIEALKWKMLAKRIEEISFARAFTGVLTGLSMGFITPRSLGGYAGRIWQLKQAGRAEAVGAIMLGRLAQFFCTLFFGCIGIGFLIRDQFHSPMLQWGILIFLPFSLLIFLLFLLEGRTRFVNLLFTLSGSRAALYFRVVDQYTRREVVRVLGLSAARYAVFSLQFVWVLSFFHLAIPVYTLFAGVTWIFIAKSIIPAFNFLSDLGIREFSALYFFSAYPVAQTGVVTASLIVWIINILLPTVAGACFVVKMKIFRN